MTKEDKRKEALEAEDFQQWREKRNQMLINLDVESAELTDKPWIVAMATLHKARYECTDTSDDLRQESRKWLEKHDMKRFGGFEFSEDGSLPE